jgi:hypothetical protein
MQDLDFFTFLLLFCRHNLLLNEDIQGIRSTNLIYIGLIYTILKISPPIKNLCVIGLYLELEYLFF